MENTEEKEKDEEVTRRWMVEASESSEELYEQEDEQEVVQEVELEKLEVRRL